MHRHKLHPCFQGRASALPIIEREPALRYPEFFIHVFAVSNCQNNDNNFVDPIESD